MGARGRSRTRAGAARRESKRDAHTPRDRRASVRHTEDAHGRDALLVRDAAESCHRDGAVRARLQSDTRAKHGRDEAAAGRGEGVIWALAAPLRFTGHVKEPRRCVRRVEWPKNMQKLIGVRQPEFARADPVMQQLFYTTKTLRKNRAATELAAISASGRDVWATD